MQEENDEMVATRRGYPTHLKLLQKSERHEKPKEKHLLLKLQQQQQQQQQQRLVMNQLKIRSTRLVAFTDKSNWYLRTGYSAAFFADL